MSRILVELEVATCIAIWVVLIIVSIATLLRLSPDTPPLPIAKRNS